MGEMRVGQGRLALGFALTCALLVGCGGDKDGPSQAEIDKMQAESKVMVEQLEAEKAEKAKKAQARKIKCAKLRDVGVELAKAAGGDDVHLGLSIQIVESTFRGCSLGLSDAEVDCSIAATSFKAFKACSE